ncbi:sorbosone dehydrogenase family protein [Pseudorhodoferax sp. Leaf267]|uniref:PQQ-dependent sugar dehydrogenase n=1 Tax=Pseudorhodoferax sp. Leaf267 TaxID=1736316 RepID=UPI0006FE99C3|nr:sorbosone dehydrogenase family protein [Pseudorhodoferax sp. Leaf267]KQP21974.1 sorbosone dehydrogenase [Pseudorhodoferax sp. Leaf267]
MTHRPAPSAHLYKAPIALLLGLALVGCGETSKLPDTTGIGSAPQLPAPGGSLIPTVKVAPVKGWPAGTMPTPAAGTKVQAFATGLDHPRWLYTLPNGDVLVAESNKPANAGEGKKPSIRGWVQGLFMKRAGAAVPSADRITLLRDADGDGVAEVKTVLLQGLTSPFGMALVGNELFVANADAVVKFPFTQGQTSITAAATKVADLPSKINHHWTKNLLPNADGSKLYVTVGSNSNIGENGLENEEGRAAIWEVDAKTGTHRIFASGLRNPNGLAWEPVTGKLWTVVNERDELGNDLVPDYMTSVQDGGFYGWPWSYYGQHVDERVKPPMPDMVAKAIKPDYALGSHVAALGLAISDGKQMVGRYGAGAFIGEHGSWNRKPVSGYKVVFVPFMHGIPSGMPQDVLTGFLNADGEALGRPVGVVFDAKGALLVADDVGNAVWRVAPAAP